MLNREIELAPGISFKLKKVNSPSKLGLQAFRVFFIPLGSVHFPPAHPLLWVSVDSLLVDSDDYQDKETIKVTIDARHLARVLRVLIPVCYLSLVGYLSTYLWNIFFLDKGILGFLAMCFLFPCVASLQLFDVIDLLMCRSAVDVP
jgi:hypothetical protein